MNTRPNLVSPAHSRRLVLVAGGLLSVAVLSGCSPLKALRGDPVAYQVQLLPGSSREKSFVRSKVLDCPSPTYHATTWTPLQPPDYVRSACTSCAETETEPTAESEPRAETDSEAPSPELAPEEVPVPPPMSPENGVPAPPEEPDVAEPGFDEPKISEPGLGIPGLGEPPLSVPGPSEPAPAEPGLSEPGFDEPAPVQPGLSEPDEDQPRKLEPPDVIDLPFPDAGASRELPDAGASREVPPRRLGEDGASDRDGSAEGAPVLVAPEIDLVGASLAEGAEPWSSRIVSGD